jgi:hypothetical protein
VRVLREARKLLLVPDHVAQDDHAATAALCRRILELPALEVVWDAQEHAGLCVQLVRMGARPG